MSNEIAVQNNNSLGLFDPGAFESAQRIAKALMSSELVPDIYRPTPNKRSSEQD